jgi:peptide deformylase
MAIKQLIFLAINLSIASGYSQETTCFQTQEKECSMSAPIFTPPGDFSLQENATEVAMDEILSEGTQFIIEQMYQAAKGERNEIGENQSLVGLAAPQIGYSKRIILVDTGVDSERTKLGSLTAYINPEITWYSDEIDEGRESCYSVDSRVIGIVPRSEKIQIRAFDRNGLPVSAEFSGFTARIFQHEIDHLNGIRFPERVGSDGKLHWVEDSEYEEYKKDCNNWNCKCPWQTWVSMKSGESYAVPSTEQSK